MGSRTSVEDHRPSFVTISATGGGLISFTVGLDPEAAEAVTKQLNQLFPQEPVVEPPFDPLVALTGIARHLGEKRSLSHAENLAIAVLNRALRLAEQDTEHNALTEAGI